MNEPDSKFNQAQQDSLKRAYDDLSEHFDHVLMVVAAETGDSIVTSRMFYSGGFIPAVGMAALANRDLMNNCGHREVEPT